MPEQEPIDPLPKMIAGIDQFIAAMPELARAARGFFAAYVEEGFTEAQALELTKTWIDVTLRPQP